MHSIDDIKPHHNYSLSEAREVLNMSAKKLYNLRREGTLRYYLREADSEVRVKGSELIRFYNS